MQDDTRKISWNAFGPVLLLGAFAAVLLKGGTSYWPLGVTAFVGYAATLYFRKKGVYLSLLSLVAVAFLTLKGQTGLFWPLFLTASISISWMLVYLGNEEQSVVEKKAADSIHSLQEACLSLEKQLREAKKGISQENKDLLSEREHLTARLKHAEKTLQASLGEREKLVQKCETLSQDLFAAQRKEVSFQQALEDAQAQLSKLKNTTSEALQNIIPQEETSAEEKLQLEQTLHNYANLRQQFEEKSEALDAARKELFRTENELLALQKAWEEKANDFSEESQFFIRDLKKMEEEMAELEAQISLLQDCISALLLPKKRAVRSKKGQEKLTEALPLILQEKIDRTLS
jgi:chromosome segregation ATPase